MKMWSHAAFAAILVSTLACTGGTEVAPPAPTPPPAPPVVEPAPVAAPDEGTEKTVDAVGGAAGDHWCCQYEGPLGKTHDLLENPAACAEQYKDHAPEFVNSPMCAPVCCKYATDAADLGKGYEWKTVATGNCNLRSGVVEQLAEGATCHDPAKPKPVTKPVVKPTERQGGTPTEPEPTRTKTGKFRPGGK